MAEDKLETSSGAGTRRIRSFVRREGRMTDGQREALESLSPRYSLDHMAGTLDFAQAFGRVAPVSFEIGFGNGEALLGRATARAHINHVGVEVHRPGVGRLMMNVQARELENVRVMSRDAVEILRDQVAESALDEIVIEFPDPWHKKRHHKRRLIQPAFVQLLVSRLKTGGELRLATDWANYAEQMLEVLSANASIQNMAQDGSFIERPDSRPIPRFEARGTRLGHAVFDLLFQKK